VNATAVAVPRDADLFDARLLAESALAAYERAVAQGRQVTIEMAHLARIGMITSTGGSQPEVMLAAVADELAIARTPSARAAWPAKDRGLRVTMIRRLLDLGSRLGMHTDVRYGPAGASTPYLQGPCPGGGAVTVQCTETGWTWQVRDATGRARVDGSWADSHAPVEMSRVAHAVRADANAFATRRAQRSAAPTVWILSAADRLEHGTWRLDQVGSYLRLRVTRHADAPPLWFWSRVQGEDRRVQWSWSVGGDGREPGAAFMVAGDPADVATVVERFTSRPEPPGVSAETQKREAMESAA
jgi:hypothetical protein